MSQPPPCPADRMFSGLIGRIAFALEALRAAGIVTSALLALAMRKFGAAQASFRRLQARIAAGTYRPRRAGPRTPPQTRKPPDQGRLRQRRGWLAAVLPQAPPCRGDLLALLAEPETARLIQAAPAAMRRIFRPLCWSLGLQPPPCLAIPRRPRPAAEAPPQQPSRPAAAPPAPPHAEPWLAMRPKPYTGGRLGRPPRAKKA